MDWRPAVAGPNEERPPACGAGAEGEEMTKPPTKAEREAHKAFRPVNAKKAMTEHETAQKAFSNNRERLKAERLAREAAAAKLAVASA